MDQSSSSEAWPAAERPEPSLADKPLEFLLEHSSNPDAWKPLVWDESRRCFAFHLPDAFEPSLRPHFFQKIRDLAPWQPVQDKTRTKISRHTCWYTRSSSCNCAYTYGEDIRVEAPSEKSAQFRSIMDSLTACVFSKFPGLPEEAWPNCANVNYYSDGDEGVGWHADDELIFMGTARDCPILSLSLGGMREFWIALKSDSSVEEESSAAPDVRKGVLEVDVKDGDLLTMEGFMQKHTMHCVPRSCPSDVARQQPRINVTFRWMRIHKQECPYAKVAQTWFMLTGSSEAENVLAEGNADGDDEKKHTRGMIKILDPTTGKPIENTGLSRPSRRVSKKEKLAIMSPMPAVSRALFGEGERKPGSVPPRPGASKEGFLLAWDTGVAARGPAAGRAAAATVARATVRWQPCDSCGHICWGGGRPCKSGGQGSDQWFCRCCWVRWAEEDAAAAAYQEASAPPQYPDLALSQYADPSQFSPFYGGWVPTQSPYGCAQHFAPTQASAFADPRFAMYASAGFPCPPPVPPVPQPVASPWAHQV